MLSFDGAVFILIFDYRCKHYSLGASLDLIYVVLRDGRITAYR